jgi:HEPN domain-containing protein
MTLKKNKPRHRLALLTTALGFALTFHSLMGADLSTQPPEMPPSVAPDSVVPPNPASDPALFTQTDPSNAIAQADAVPLSSPSTTSAPSEPTTPAPAAQPSTLNSQPSTLNPSKSQNVTVNLINRLVERGILTKQDSTDLIQQAEKDASDARIEAQQGAMQAAAQAAQAAVAQAVPPPPSEDSVRVTYIPEIVKNQMRDQIKQEVMDQAREENWAAPRTLPEWAPRFRFTGDVRIRYEGSYYPKGNDNTGGFPNFNAINTGAPFDTAGNTFSPQYNVDQQRTRVRLRARLAAEVDLGEGFTSGMRIATGDSNSPVTTNQTLGGSGGDFSKYQLWLDRAYIKYQASNKDGSLTVNVGRFDNPFFSTTALWDDDLGFDGIAGQGKYEVAKGVTPFLTGGLFPVYNTDLNFATNSPTKFKSRDKWLSAVQSGVEWKIDKDLTAKAAVAYYHFTNIEGKLSDPYTPLTNQDAGNTDTSRPSFAQKGNTYMALRDIVGDSTNNYGTSNQWQYYGLATPFHELAFTGRLDYNRWEPFQVSLVGEFIRNLAFNRSAIESIAVNNRGATSSTNTSGAYEGGDTAWMVTFKVGAAALQKRWDWNADIGYRYVESDALVDGFADSDFGGGGTNLRGFTIGGNLALSSRVWLGARWMSASSIAGPTYKNDILQVDLNAKF